ncbi:hypothetical protein MMAD_38780 [Mycolicibacterium madagascariense]|uniref:Mce associated membrane protein n=1 Tax=Mycolicibacterium madagascariense TaxID=212765 RepID=A0A7I7XKE5_9MYCO|nr:tetratricopeptide repeat protein [Mycolicibacterium madagascariense]MCV7011231.1 Mce protein [Mycolicibacterium madagascariense]BBZ29583.1 hypothetical protein MMAD_38780 [Mycolicibacterium madagascariense]
MSVDESEPANQAPERDPADGPPDAPRHASPVRPAIVAGLIVVVALAALTGWVGYRAYQARQQADQRAMFLQVGRQGALDLTVYDYDHVDAQVQRTLDLATGTFYDDFQRRAPAFAELVKQIKSTSTGTVVDAGIESQTPGAAKMLVAVVVTSQVNGQPNADPKLFRMRLSLQGVDGGAKISGVEFVS